MQKQTLAIAVETKNGIVQRIGKSAIFTPKPNFGGEASSGMWTGQKRKTTRPFQQAVELEFY